MNIVIQRIETYWTKKSRGNPGATMRNSVPELFPMEVLFDSDDVQIQDIKYSEYNDFKEPDVKFPKLINTNQQRETGFQFEENKSLLTVSLWKKNGILKELAILKPESWLQTVSNYRTSSFESFWSYHKYVFNIFYGTLNRANTITSSKKPEIIYNYERNLW